jgi:hypothetical protein
MKRFLEFLKTLAFRIKYNFWGTIHPYNPEDPWQKDMSDLRRFTEADLKKFRKDNWSRVFKMPSRKK